MREEAQVVGVRMGNAGKIHYYHSGGMRLETGEYVVVQTTRGPELARVVVAPEQIVASEMDHDGLKPILRLATTADLVKADDLKLRAKELLDEARRLAGEAGFPARLDAAEFTLDGRRLTVAFTSEERVEYREYARRLSDALGTRVELNQVGARDRARLAGGYGICGRELCCANWLSTFPAISIRMAKDQELPLNPQKISGLCGRLLCCLSYEDEGYREMRRTLPKIGQRCSTPTGEGKVIALNILHRRVTLVVDGKRVEVGDRDLGLVVRWDTSSKSADPPPSLTTAEAVEQGLMTPEEAEEWEREREERESGWVAARPEPTRGRLPAPPAGRQGRKEPEPRQAPDRARGRGRSGDRRAGPGPGKGPAPIEGARTRSFRRDRPQAEPGEQGDAGAPEAGTRERRPPQARRPAGPPAPAPADESGSGAGRSRRRRGRRGRGRGTADGGGGAAGGDGGTGGGTD